MISLNDINSAKDKITHYLHRTPIIYSQSISDMVGADTYFKCENLQKTGSFKARGAFNKLLSLNEKEKKRGVVCYSSGNHAQAIS